MASPGGGSAIATRVLRDSAHIPRPPGCPSRGPTGRNSVESLSASGSAGRAALTAVSGRGRLEHVLDVTLAHGVVLAQHPDLLARRRLLELEHLGDEAQPHRPRL